MSHLLGVILLALALVMLLLGLLLGLRHAWRVHEALAYPTFHDYTAGMWKALIGVAMALVVGAVGAALLLIGAKRGASGAER